MDSKDKAPAAAMVEQASKAEAQRPSDLEPTAPPPPKDETPDSALPKVHSDETP